MMHWMVNGQPSSDLAIQDRSVQYGDGLFETVAIQDGEPHLWDYHLERLALGCERLGLQAPAPTLVATQLTEALTQNGLTTGAAGGKVIVTAGEGQRGYRRPEASEPTLIIGVFARQAPDPQLYTQGARLRLCNTQLAIQPQLAGIKSLNRLEQVLARAEWQDTAIFDGLVCDTEGRVICGTMSNVFIVHNSQVSTPALTRCGVSGVMRRHVLTQLANRNASVEVTDLTPADLWSATEVFVTNSLHGVVPVTRIEDHTFDIGPLTRSVMAEVPS